MVDRRQLVLTAIAVLALGCAKSDPVPAPAGSGGPAPAAPVKITYAMPLTLAAVPAYVALEQGYWKEEGLDVEAKLFSAGRLALDALLAKEAQVMSVSETPLMHAIRQGHAIVIVATVTQHAEVKAIARKDHGIAAPTDLRGKRIATLPGTNSDYFLSVFLAKHGIEPAEVKITSMQPPEMVTAFVKGDIDAYFAWEPHVQYAKEKLPDAVTVFGPDGLYKGAHCVAMNRAYAEEHPEIVDKVVRGFLRAEELIARDPAAAKGIVAKKTNLAATVIEALWPEYHFEAKIDRGIVAAFQDEGRWASAADGAKAPAPDFRAYFFGQTLAKARAGSVDSRAVSRASSRAIGVGAALLFALVWEILARASILPPLLVPPPSRVGAAFVAAIASGEWLSDVAESTRRFAVGFGLGATAGVGLGLATGRSTIARAALAPLLHFFRGTPTIALLPIAIVIFGIGETEKAFLVAWGAAFPVWVATHAGVGEVEQEYVWAARSLGLSGAALYGEVILPRALPFVLTGARTAIATAFFALAAAEMAGAFGGVAFRIFHAQQSFRTDKMLMALVTLGAMSLAFDRVFVAVMRRLVPWWTADQRGAG